MVWQANQIIKPTDRCAAVIGAGPSGLAASLELVRWGYDVHLFEQSDRLNGKAGLFCCKADDACVRCGTCHVTQLADRIMQDLHVHLHLNTTIEGIRDDGTDFHLTVKPHHQLPYQQSVRFLILATGYRIFDPALKHSYHFGQYANVISNYDLEQMLSEGDRVFRRDNGLPVRSMAFIQCVGSRDLRSRATYCSQICCGSAIRFAGKLLFGNPALRISIFSMDIQIYSREFERQLHKMQPSVRLIRGLPGEVLPGSDGSLVLRYELDQSDQLIEETFDMVVLSVGIRPEPLSPAIRDSLSLILNPHGFLEPKPDDDRLAIVGTATGPMNIIDSIKHAQSIVSQKCIRGLR